MGHAVQQKHILPSDDYVVAQQQIIQPTRIPPHDIIAAKQWLTNLLSRIEPNNHQGRPLIYRAIDLFEHVLKLHYHGYPFTVRITPRNLTLYALFLVNVLLDHHSQLRARFSEASVINYARESGVSEQMITQIKTQIEALQLLETVPEQQIFSLMNTWMDTINTALKKDLIDQIDQLEKETITADQRERLLLLLPSDLFTFLDAYNKKDIHTLQPLDPKQLALIQWIYEMSKKHQTIASLINKSITVQIRKIMLIIMDGYKLQYHASLEAPTPAQQEKLVAACLAVSTYWIHTTEENKWPTHYETLLKMTFDDFKAEYDLMYAVASEINKQNLIKGQTRLLQQQNDQLNALQQLLQETSLKKSSSIQIKKNIQQALANHQLTNHQQRAWIAQQQEDRQYQPQPQWRQLLTEITQIVQTNETHLKALAHDVNLLQIAAQKETAKKQNKKNVTVTFFPPTPPDSPDSTSLESKKKRHRTR